MPVRFPYLRFLGKAPTIITRLLMEGGGGVVWPSHVGDKRTSK